MIVVVLVTTVSLAIVANLAIAVNSVVVVNLVIVAMVNVVVLANVAPLVIASPLAPVSVVIVRPLVGNVVHALAYALARAPALLKCAVTQIVPTSLSRALCVLMPMWRTTLIAQKLSTTLCVC